jgi:hypothetical protein
MARRTAVVAVGLVCAMALVASVTAALFQVSQNGAGGSVLAGVLDLRVKNNVTGWLDGISADKPTWTMSNMASGQYMDYDYAQVRQVDLRNALGSLPGSTVDLTVVNKVVDSHGSSSGQHEPSASMDQMMQIVSMEYVSNHSYGIIDPSDPSASMIVDANGNGWIDLDDLENSPVEGLAAPSGLASVQLRLRYRPEAGNEFEGHALVSDLKVTEHQ